MRFAAFIVHFLLYAITLGIAYAIANGVWIQDGLDLNANLAGYHSLAVTCLAIAPFVLALVAMVARPLAVFVLFYLVGAVLTAPFALARFAG